MTCWRGLFQRISAYQWKLFWSLNDLSPLPSLVFHHIRRMSEYQKTELDWGAQCVDRDSRFRLSKLRPLLWHHSLLMHLMAPVSCGKAELWRSCRACHENTSYAVEGVSLTLPPQPRVPGPKTLLSPTMGLAHVFALLSPFILKQTKTAPDRVIIWKSQILTQE